MSEAKPKAAFITFYSFKGGVGRSMALINTAGILAGRGFRVLVLDLDLEAPGLSYLDPDAPDISPEQQQSRVRPLQLGFVDLLSDAKERGEEADLFVLSANEIAERYTQPYHLPEELREFKDGSLHIMPAGKFDGDYAQRFDALNLRELYQEGLGEPLIRVFKQKLVEADLYDYVLVDSRTGFSDEAGICTRDLADYLMILSGLNRQNIEGTCEFLKALRVATAGEKRFQIILSPVPNGEDALLDQREAMAKASFEAAWGAKVDLSLQIPYHPQLALTEEPHIFRRRRGYLFEAYRAIERSMLSALDHDAWTVIQKINKTLQKKDYPTVLRDLRYLIRLDGGKSALAELIYDLGEDDRQFPRSKAEGEKSQDKVTLDEILSDEKGKYVVKFIADHLPVGEMDWRTKVFLWRIKDNFIELADRLYKRMVNAVPSDAETLSDYASFLVQQRGDLDEAESYYQRALEADPGDAEILSNYASFLVQQRGDLDGAESYYQRALEVDPEHVAIIGNYAIFLAWKRGDLDGAESYYRRALEANPKHANHLGNYGQFLVGLARLSEGEQLLVSAFECSDQYDRSNVGNIAEICYSLWLVARMQRDTAEHWERFFKFLIQKGFKRYLWGFEQMLDQAKKILSPEEFEYAEALAHAFLDESQVSNLDRYERWRTLEPLDPMEAGNKYSEHIAASIPSASS